MNAPFSLSQGHVLLLAEPQSFSAAYIRRSLELFGVKVIAPDVRPEQALASLDPAEWMSVSACIAVDLGQALFEMLSTQRREIPFIFVGQDPGAWFSGPYSWLCPPFAAFQVVERLGEMMAAASAAMQASLDFATAASGQSAN
jgi:hypothetical protein